MGSLHFSCILLFTIILGINDEKKIRKTAKLTINPSVNANRLWVGVHGPYCLSVNTTVRKENYIFFAILREYEYTMMPHHSAGMKHGISRLALKEEVWPVAEKGCYTENCGGEFSGILRAAEKDRKGKSEIKHGPAVSSPRYVSNYTWKRRQVVDSHIWEGGENVVGVGGWQGRKQSI